MRGARVTFVQSCCRAFLIRCFIIDAITFAGVEASNVASRWSRRFQIDVAKKKGISKERALGFPSSSAKFVTR